MEILNNISPLPFYTDISLQHHRKDYAFGQIYPLIAPGDNILPFQFMIKQEAGASFNDSFNGSFSKGAAINLAELVIDYVKLWDFKTNTAIDITDNIVTINRLEVIPIKNGLWIIKYPGTTPIQDLNQQGPYYLEIHLTSSYFSQSVYSDIFISSHDTSCYTKIEYGNSYNLNLPEGYIDFSDNFKFLCFLDTEIGKPEYTFEETAAERMGYTFVESQISKKVYKFIAIAPEYLCDALRIIRLCNSKKIFTERVTYKPLSFAMDVKWEEQGDLASIECEFETDTVITNIGNTL